MFTLFKNGIRTGEYKYICFKQTAFSIFQWQGHFIYYDQSKFSNEYIQYHYICHQQHLSDYCQHPGPFLAPGFVLYFCQAQGQREMSNVPKKN